MDVCDGETLELLKELKEKQVPMKVNRYKAEEKEIDVFFPCRMNQEIFSNENVFFLERLMKKNVFFDRNVITRIWI